MKEIYLDESSGNEYCEEFLTNAIEMDKLDLLFNFMQRKKTKSFGIQKDLI